MENLSINKSAKTLADRITYATAQAVANQVLACDKYERYNECLIAFVRSCRRHMGLNPHGLAPISVFRAAESFATKMVNYFNVDGDYALAESAIRPQTLRRLVRRARKGTL